MAHHFAWYDPEQTILLVEMAQGWSVADFTCMVDEMIPLVTARQQRVDLIADFTMTSIVPQNILQIGNRTIRKVPPNLARSVIVTESAMLRALVRIFGSVYRQVAEEVISTTTIEDAVEWIQQQRNSKEGN